MAPATARRAPHARAILDAAYQGAPPEVFERAASSLGRALERVAASRWEGVAWAFSSLTSSGFPVELSFGSGRDEIRYTTEVAGPEVGPRDRLEHALGVLADMGAGLPDDACAAARGIQARRELRYGCWLGGRHAIERDGFRLYVEVPPGAEVSVVPGALSDHRLIPRMVAFDGAAVEVYYRVGQMGEWSASILPAPLRDGLPAIEALVEDVARRPARSVLRGRNWGCSVASSWSGEPLTVASFTFARRLVGDDAAIRERLTEVARRRGWTLPHYAAATEHLASEHGRRTSHGLVSAAASAGGAVHLGIGVSAREDGR